jgi:hypothetical protein
MKNLYTTIVFCLFALICYAQNDFYLIGFGSGKLPIIDEKADAIDFTYQRVIMPHIGGRISICTYGMKRNITSFGIFGDKKEYSYTQKERLTSIDFNLFLSLRKIRRKLNAYAGSGFSLFRSSYYGPNTIDGDRDQGFIVTHKTQNINAGMFNFFYAINLRIRHNIIVEFSTTYRFYQPFRAPLNYIYTNNSLEIPRPPRAFLFDQTSNVNLRLGYRF